MIRQQQHQVETQRMNIQRQSHKRIPTVDCLAKVRTLTQLESSLIKRLWDIRSQRDVDFEEIYFEGIYFKGTDIEEIYFEGIYFEEIDVEGIYFEEIYFEKTDVEQMSISSKCI